MENVGDMHIDERMKVCTSFNLSRVNVLSNAHYSGYCLKQKQQQKSEN